MFQNHLRTALRNLIRNLGISFLNLLGLSVGMTAAILIFLWVDNELTFDSYHPGANHIYRLTIGDERSASPSTPLPLGQKLRTDLPSAEGTASMQPAFQTNIDFAGDLIAEKTGAYVDSGWFSMFHYDFIAGSPASFNRNLYSLILTESKARKYFGDKNPVGQNLLIDSIPYRIAGVVRDIPANSSFQADILMPMGALLTDSNERKFSMNWGNYSALTFVKLHPAADTAAAAHTIADILTKNNPRFAGNTISLLPIKDMHFETLTTNGILPHTDSKTVYIFSLLGISLLLIACINYVNLTTARASLRAKEVGIRKIIGAGKASLFSQFLIESFTISILSLALTLVLVSLAMPLFRQLTGTGIREPFASPDTWKIIGGTLLAAALLNGIYPAMLLASFEPLNTLKGIMTIKFKDISLRKSLVVLQFSFSIVLIAGTIIIQRQLNYIQHTSPGYNRSQIFTFRLPWSVIKQKTDDQTNPEDQSKSTAQGFKQQLLAYPAISGVSFASQSIVDLFSSNTGSANWDGKDPEYTPQVFQLVADEAFKTVTQLEMAQGRWFDPLQATDRQMGFVGAASPRSSSSANFACSFVLNETAIAQFNIRRPVIGQRFIFQRDTGRIIGVVKDFHYASMRKQVGPLVIYNRPSSAPMLYIKTAPGKAPEALAAAHTVFSQFVPHHPFAYTFLDESFNALYITDIRASNLILIFSIIAILISSLGLLGLAAFTARQRVREIGIRKVLGASVANIITLLSRDFIRLVLLSVAIATPIAWWAMHGWLEDFAYHIPLSPWVFALAGILALVIAVLTVATQSIKAARTNPIKNLRTD